MTEDLVLLEKQARRFIAAEFVPHLDRWHEEGMYPREVWTKAGEAGLLCASIPEEYGGAGGSFAHGAVINRELSLAGFDAFGVPLHSRHRRSLHLPLRLGRAEAAAGCRSLRPVSSSASLP